MPTIVKSHKRKGKTVKSHVRKSKKGNPKQLQFDFSPKVENKQTRDTFYKGGEEDEFDKMYEQGVISAHEANLMRKKMYKKP
jgi:hypothetical protein